MEYYLYGKWAGCYDLGHQWHMNGPLWHGRQMPSYSSFVLEDKREWIKGEASRSYRWIRCTVNRYTGNRDGLCVIPNRILGGFVDVRHIPPPGGDQDAARERVLPRVLFQKDNFLSGQNTELHHAAMHRGPRKVFFPECEHLPMKPLHKVFGMWLV